MMELRVNEQTVSIKSVKFCLISLKIICLGLFSFCVEMLDGNI